MKLARQAGLHRVRVPSFAKINLTLKVLGKRGDGYHELRTVLQTISLADAIDIEYTPSPRVEVSVECNLAIEDNIAARAARALLDELGLGARVHIRIQKRIPMGAGLGGGSSNAAAILLALPALAGKVVAPADLLRLAAALGSDVPFFLVGGTALALGRGEELYPFPEPATSYGLLLLPEIHVSTREAYAALSRNLTETDPSRIINDFQPLGWQIGEGFPVSTWRGFCQNDFEEVLFQRHPQLLALKEKLIRAGSPLALMTGSGSALFGFFHSPEQAKNTARLFPELRWVLFRTLGRERYRARWLKCLRAFAWENRWPPQSR